MIDTVSIVSQHRHYGLRHCEVRFLHQSNLSVSQPVMDCFGAKNAPRNDVPRNDVPCNDVARNDAPCNETN